MSDDTPKDGHNHGDAMSEDSSPPVLVRTWRTSGAADSLQAKSRGIWGRDRLPIILLVLAISVTGMFLWTVSNSSFANILHTDLRAPVIVPSRTPATQVIIPASFSPLPPTVTREPATNVPPPKSTPTISVMITANVEVTRTPMASMVVTSIPSRTLVASTATSAPRPPILLTVTGTEGMPLLIRSDPPDGRSLGEWEENTRMTYLGEESTIDGFIWKKVRDPAGTVGWMRGDYLK
jgi:hypothetical protein